IILEKCLNYLNDGISLRNINFSQSERKNILNFNFLTYKPVIYIANVDRHYKNNIYVQKLNEIGFRENSPVILHCFMNNGEFIANSQRTILHALIDNIMFFLKLNTFFTTNINMTRSWIY
ncbi:GTP-dependent nucleic acid-binding protein engD, partial [Camponotus floridanus]